MTHGDQLSIVLAFLGFGGTYAKLTTFHLKLTYFVGASSPVHPLWPMSVTPSHRTR